MSEKLSDYQYPFPEAQVAQEPLAERSASRMMVLDVAGRQWHHEKFSDLSIWLGPKDLVVVNDTQVLASRLFAQKSTGGVLEVFLLRSMGAGQWRVLLSPTRGLREGDRLSLYSRTESKALPARIQILSLTPGDFQIAFESTQVESTALSEYGETPLPPYIQRPQAQESDRIRYQTIFAQNAGAVAAPTAGLHFTSSIQEELRQKGINWANVTLHVGLGTFAPVKVEDITQHQMHEEWYEIPPATQEALVECRKNGGRIIAVGTTTLRTLESFAATGKTTGWTRLFIRPGFRFKMADHLLTNFHQPGSTLLMLVSAFAGREWILSAYEEAIQKGYRLFSYGDCMLIHRGACQADPDALS